MPLESHSLVKEFPQMKQQIHDLKMSDAHFARLFTEYDALDHEVHHIESGAKAAADTVLEDMKKKRLTVKDELFAILKKRAGAHG